MMKAEGLSTMFAHQQRLMQATRAALRALDLPLFIPDPYVASPAVTAIAPDQVAPETLRFKLQQQYGVVIAAGQDHMRGKLVRIGHLGYVCDRSIVTTIAAIEAALKDLDYPFQVGAGVEAAHRVFKRS